MNAQRGISKAIDPKRTGISKSAIVASTLCARKGWFGEHIRTADGARISIPMPERVLFGTAVDEAISWLLYRVREGEPLDDELVEMAIEEGLGAMASRPGAEELDPIELGRELAIATHAFADEILPRFDLRKGATFLQGIDGESLRDGEWIGTPDIIVIDEKYPAIWDLKTSPRSKSARDLWSPEMAHYAALYESLYGQLPKIGYITWVRTKERKWQTIAMQAQPEHLALAQQHRAATKATLDALSPATLPFATALCGTCEWKHARPEYKFGGCMIGQSIESLTERTEEWEQTNG
jgi:hypothetical protein